MISDEVDTQLPQAIAIVTANTTKKVSKPQRPMDFKADGLIRAPIASMNAEQQMRDADLYRIDKSSRSRHDLHRQESNISMRSMHSLPQLPNQSPRNQFARRDIMSLSSRSLRKLQIEPGFLQHRSKHTNNANVTPPAGLDEDHRSPNIEAEISASADTCNHLSEEGVVTVEYAVSEKIVAAVDENFHKISIASTVTSSTSTSTKQSPNTQGQDDIKFKKKAEKINIVNKIINSKSKSKWARLRSVLYLEDGREIMREAATQPNILLTVLAQTPPLDIAEYFLYHCHEDAFMERDEWGRTPLHLAATHPTEDSCELVEALLDRFPEAATIQDAYGRTPLMLACSHGKEMDARAIRVLIRASHSTVIAEDEDGCSALEYALLSEVSHKVFLRLQKSHACTLKKTMQQKKVFAKSA